MMSRYTCIALTTVCLATTSLASASEWTMIGGTFDSATTLYPGYSFMDGEETLNREVSIPSFYSGFGVGGEWVLRNKANPEDATLIFGFLNLGTGRHVPQVNLTPGSEWIDVSGMYVYGAGAPALNDGSGIYGGWLYNVAIGYGMTPVEDVYQPGPSGGYKLSYRTWGDRVPLIVNGDGTYTAIWQWYMNGTPSGLPPDVDTALSQMSITFRAAPVPEPAQATLLALGLLGIAVRMRCRRRG